MEKKIDINGVAVLFEFSISINTVTSQKPTEFAMNYLKTLGNMSAKHLSMQIGEAMVERVRDDFKSYPKEELWKGVKVD